MLTDHTAAPPCTARTQTPRVQQNFADVLAFWQVANSHDSAMDTRQQTQLLTSELTRISAQQDHLKMAIAEAMADSGETFTISPLKSFKLHEKEAQLAKEEEWESQPDSPSIQAGWVEPEATIQVIFVFIFQYWYATTQGSSLPFHQFAYQADSRRYCA